MDIKTLICPLIGAAGLDDLDAVIALCRENELHLKIPLIHLEPPAPIAGEAPLSEAWVSDLREVRVEATARATALELALHEQSLSAEVHPVVRAFHQVGPELGLQARYADLSVASASTQGRSDLRNQMLYGMLFESGRPMIVEPVDQSHALTLAPETVLVAWDGGVAASRAVMLATTLLKSASVVHVVCVDPGGDQAVDGQAPGWDLAAYLARHQIEVAVDAIPRGGLTVDEAIARHAIEVGAELVVMGAYGHSRLRESIFGGTSKAMLRGCKVPVFMAH